MFTRHAIAVAVLVAATAAAAQPAPSPATATPPKPVAKPAAAAPSQPAPSKPAVAAPAPAASVQPAPAVSAQPATVAFVAPLPRQKPKWPPSPRSKPEAPVEVASAPLAPAPAIAAAPPTAQPIAANGQEALAACGNACSEILFKTVDNCLWVQSANPRPITFSAEVGGRPVALKLEGADPNKADAHTAALKGAPAKDESAYHTRLHDPFVSVAPGIPAYRARLGPPTSCVKSRNEIQKFTATFAG